MRYKTSIAFQELNGSAKGVTASRNASGTYLQSRSRGGRRGASDGQSEVRALFHQLQKSWKELEEDERRLWQTAAESAQGRRVLGQSAKLTGGNLYLRLNFWVVRLGGSALTEPPMLCGVESPADAQLFVTGDGISLELDHAPELGGLKLVVMAIGPQSMGAVKPAGKGAMLGDAKDADDEAFDLTDEYVAKYGSVTEGMPRVIMRYFLVDSETGEKSLEKTVCGILSAGPGTRYTLTTGVDDADHGSVSPAAGEHEYNAGAQVTVEATAAEGYAFDSWSDGSTENPKTVVMNADLTLTAQFVVDMRHTVTVVASPTAGGTVSGGGSYNHGDTATLKAVADRRYDFIGWADDETAGATRTVTVDADASYTALFRLRESTHKLMLHTNLETAGTTIPEPDVEKEYNDGDEDEIEAYPASDYHFVKWSDGNTSNPRMMVYDHDVELTAIMESEFEANVGAEVFPANSGDVTGTGSYPVGRKVTVTAEPEDEFIFDHWEDDETAGATREFYLGEDGVNLKAYFVSEYEAVISAECSPEDGGSVSGTGTFNIGKQITLEAIAEDGYEFDHWEDDDEAPARRTVTVEEDTCFTAVFREL